MLKYIFFTFFLVYGSDALIAQSNVISASKISNFSVDADAYVGLDNLGYYYYLKNNVLIKKRGAEFWQYQNVGLGEINSVDIINPLKIVIFYENFNKVVLVDNQLNEIQVIDFAFLQVPIIARNVGMSGQNCLWVFDALTQQIVLFNYETFKYRFLNQSLKSTFICFQSDFNFVFWLDDQHILYQMDAFGKKDIVDAACVFDAFQYYSNGGYIYSNNNKLFFKSNSTAVSTLIKISETSIKNFTYSDKILTIFTGKEIITYNLNLP